MIFLLDAVVIVKAAGPKFTGAKVQFWSKSITLGHKCYCKMYGRPYLWCL